MNGIGAGRIIGAETDTRQVLKLAFYAWIIAAQGIKTLYVATCDCHGVGQPFSSWFFQAFHQSPYSLYWNYGRIRFLAGPYSLIWWFLNSPAYFGYSVFFAYLLTCDTVGFYLFQKKSRAYGLYFLTLTVWFTTVDPVDFFPVLFAVAGRYRAVFLVLAPLTKLPVGSELWTHSLTVWTWTFTNSNSFSAPENFGRYILLGTVWLVSLAFYLADKKHVTVKFTDRLARLNPVRSTWTVTIARQPELSISEH